MNKEELEIYPEKIEKHTENYKKARQTLKTAFPKKEQVPFWSLQLLSNTPEVDTLSWHDRLGNYIGMSYSIHHNNKLLILYLALEKTSRNKGYGTKIIKYLQEKDTIEETVLDIESPLQESENISQRQRRQLFYERQGFHSTNHEIIEPLCHYLIMGTSLNSEQTIKTYVYLTEILSKGLCKLKIEEVK